MDGGQPVAGPCLACRHDGELSCLQGVADEAVIRWRPQARTGLNQGTVNRAVMARSAEMALPDQAPR